MNTWLHIQTGRHCRLVFFTLSAGFLATGFSPAWALDEVQRQALHLAAKETGDKCLGKMHHDTDEFSECVDQELENSGKSPVKQLGQAYLGLVGCLSAGRIATLHAAECSVHYLRRADRLQKKLNVKDSELCATVAGNCPVRLAQIQALRKKG